MTASHRSFKRRRRRRSFNRLASLLVSHPLKIRQVVFPFFQFAAEIRVPLFLDLGIARHDPGILLVWMANYGERMVRVDVENVVGGVDDAEETHPPLGIGLGVYDGADRVVSLQLSLRRSLPEFISGLDLAVGQAFIGFRAIPTAFIDRCGRVSVDLTSSHEFFDIDPLGQFLVGDGVVRTGGEQKDSGNENEG